MKYVVKNGNAREVLAYEDELKANGLDKDSLADTSVHPTMKGADVYEQVRSFMSFSDLKNHMFAEQGGICCYCGCRLQYPTHPQYIVEHVYPKEKDRTLAGEYENILLSCRPTAAEEEERKDVPKKERMMFLHCDKAKGSEILVYTPLQNGCSEYFDYDVYGGVSGKDADACKDIETLNLNCKWLKSRRAAAIEGAIFDEEGLLLSDDELRHRLKTIMNLDAQGMYSEFCFVIQDVIRSLL